MIAPESEADLAEAIAAADGPLAVRGGGTRPVGHVSAGLPLTTQGLTGVTTYEPEALTLVAMIMWAGRTSRVLPSERRSMAVQRPDASS